MSSIAHLIGLDSKSPLGTATVRSLLLLPSPRPHHLPPPPHPTGRSQRYQRCQSRPYAFLYALLYLLSSPPHPVDLPALASGAKLLDSDLRSAYLDALAATERTEKEQDRTCTSQCISSAGLANHGPLTVLERAREFVELDDQVQQSTHLLSELSSFLSVFQRDLSAVSGHISELQGRSKTIEARLQARKVRLLPPP